MKLSIKLGTCELSIDNSRMDLDNSELGELLGDFRKRFLEVRSLEAQRMAIDRAKIEAEKSRDDLSLQLADKVCRAALAYVVEVGPGVTPQWIALESAVNALVKEQGTVRRSAAGAK